MPKGVSESTPIFSVRHGVLAEAENPASRLFLRIGSNISQVRLLSLFWLYGCTNYFQGRDVQPWMQNLAAQAGGAAAQAEWGANGQLCV